MKKLDEIPKKSIFEAPEGYFDRLPGIIQARVSPLAVGAKQGPQWMPYFFFGLKYALLVLLRHRPELPPSGESAQECDSQGCRRL